MKNMTKIYELTEVNTDTGERTLISDSLGAGHFRSLGNGWRCGNLEFSHPEKILGIWAFDRRHWSYEGALKHCKSQGEVHEIWDPREGDDYFRTRKIPTINLLEEARVAGVELACVPEHLGRELIRKLIESKGKL